MKKVLCLLMCAVLTAAALCACSKTEEFTPDYSAAIGAIFVNDQQELPENTKVYADFSDNTYSFDLDAACVYYFAAAGDVYYAGDQNFTSLSFGANLDDGTVGAQGTAAYCRERAPETPSRPTISITMKPASTSTPPLTLTGRRSPGTPYSPASTMPVL